MLFHAQGVLDEVLPQAGQQCHAELRLSLIANQGVEIQRMRACVASALAGRPEEHVQLCVHLAEEQKLAVESWSCCMCDHGGVYVSPVVGHVRILWSFDRG